MAAGIRSDETHVFPRFLDLASPSIERGDGVWLTTTDGRRILDACSGGAMVSCLGSGVPEIVEAAAEQAERLSYFYNHHFTSEPQERLADRLLEVVAPGMARVRLVSGGSEANETALQLARLYHVERGDTDRWRVISQAQSYHGSTMGTLALTGRRALQEPYTPYLAVPPPHPALDVAHRPERRGGARRARPAPRGGRTGDDRRVLLRAGRVRRRCRRTRRRIASGRASTNAGPSTGS